MNADFIKAYKAAHSLDMTKQQLAEYLNGITVSTVDRKRQKVKQRTGLSLPMLRQGEEGEELDFTTYQKFLLAVDDNGKIFKPVKVEKKRRYVITSAQTSTPVNEDFLKTLEVYCEHNDAQLLIIPFRYTNPSSIWSAPSKEEYIAPSIEKYLMPEHISLLPSLEVLGDTRVVPTAVNPVNGIDSLTGNASGIIGHPKVQLKTIATPSKELPKIMASTGAVTIKNYTQSKAGKRGEFHHSFSAIIVEIDGDNRFHMRHMHYDDNGRMYDLNKYYTKKSVDTYEGIPVLVMGDVHAIYSDPEVESATFSDEDSICNLLKPEKIIIHDCFDGYATNTHHIGNDIITYGKHHFGRGNLADELQITADYLDMAARYADEIYIVKSNHDEQIDRLLKSTTYCPKTDPENSVLFYYLKYHQMLSIEMSETGFSSMDPFRFWCENPHGDYEGLRSDNIVFLSRGDTLTQGDYMLQFHGDVGPSGSRGSISNLSKLGKPVIIGHSHAPEIKEGSIQVGLSAKHNLEYAMGPSRWLSSHSIIYPNDKATLINIIDGNWKI